MSGRRLIRVSSRALGEPARVRVYVYDDPARMRAEAVAFNGDLASADPDVQGTTQVWTDDQGRTGAVVVRLARRWLGTEHVVHEMHHASTALYGATLPVVIARDTHLTHYNERFAHLHSDLVRRLVDRLYALGYYDG